MNLTGLSIGHYTNQQSGTGLTVFLPDVRIPCGWWLCGSAPATRNVNSLDLGMTTDRIDALLFTGGSAYGLGATNGVMQWLKENNRGYQTQYGVIPIVPTAGIFDFGVNGMFIPTTENAYLACQQATKGNTLHGRIGVGTGASVGKWLKQGKTMSGGFGFFELNGPDDLIVLACAVVNSIGDVIDEQGRVVAGAIKPDGGGFSDLTAALLAGEYRKLETKDQNTTLVTIFTNARFDKIQLTRIAKMASAGIARATQPAFTRYDGDLVFSASLGTVQAEEVVAGALAAKATQLAILNAVKDSIVLG